MWSIVIGVFGKDKRCDTVIAKSKDRRFARFQLLNIWRFEKLLWQYKEEFLTDYY